jgi:predicted DsbA family dithiol-disulfide isomerase
MPAHLLLCAIRLIERKGGLAAGAQRQACHRVREAFFREARDISSQTVLDEIVRELGLDTNAITAAFESGRAHAELASDLQLAREQDIRVSPTLSLNEGRQRLSGNVGYRVIVANVRELLERPEPLSSWC